ncbi:MAG: hypothetical protein Q8L78_06125 [Coxiellaceae bacterium]|nr:hypothetical protein [Coxiellaceae bacterium]
MRQEHAVVDQSSSPLFTAEFAKRQYVSLYRFIEMQGDQPTFIYPGILLYIKEAMEKLRLNDDCSIFNLLYGLKRCREYVKMTEKQGSKIDQAYKAVFRASLNSVCESIIRFLLKKDPALGETKKAKIIHRWGVTFPTLTTEMKAQISWETYVQSDLPSAKPAR